MTELGKPTYFNVDLWLDLVEAYIRSDEVEIAFWVLDHAPAYYRMNVPPRAKAIRERLNKQLFTPIQYAGCLEPESEKYTSEMQMPSRGELLDKLVKELNEKEIVPVVMELAPGSRWIDGVMTARGRKFWYEHMGLDKQWIKMAKAPEPSYNIFVAFEIIEHLADPMEIYRNYLKFERKADAIFLSTPYCTWNGGMEDWASNYLGHLRTYTPHEFLAEAKKMFEGFEWQILVDDKDGVQVLIGKKQ